MQSADTFAQMLAKARSGDGEAFRHLVEPLELRLAPLLVRLLPRNGFISGHDALQESLLAAWRSLQDFRGGTYEQFTAWIRQIVISKARNSLRTLRAGIRDHRKQKPLSSDSAAGMPGDALIDRATTPSEQVSKEEQDARIRNAIDELPDVRANILHLKLLLGYSFQEVSDALDVPLGTVAQHYYQGIVALRQKLGAGANSSRS
jgi:RNA polymerase sigma-70 factor, ECF subfamily